MVSILRNSGRDIMHIQVTHIRKQRDETSLFLEEGRTKRMAYPGAVEELSFSECVAPSRRARNAQKRPPSFTKND